MILGTGPDEWVLALRDTSFDEVLALQLEWDGSPPSLPDETRGADAGADSVLT